MATILVINGPNLNLLGTREPQNYGTKTLSQISQTLKTIADSLGHKILTFQSNAEHKIIDQIQNAENDNIEFIIINPAAFTHTSIAIRDALLSVSIPFIEIHLSNINKREPFRQHSYFSDIAEGVITGLGPVGYEHALRSAIEILGK